MIAESENWRGRTMASILLERLDKEDDVQRLLRAKPTPSERVRFSEYRDELVMKARGTPMVLVESVWKTNELVWESRGKTAMYAAAALGELKESRALDVLILFVSLERSSSQFGPGFRLGPACEALGSLQSSRAVGVLLEKYMAYLVWTWGEACLEAVGNCVDPATLSAVRDAAFCAPDTGRKKALERLLHTKEQEFAVPRRGAPTKNP
jgi:hypothetical protein